MKRFSPLRLSRTTFALVQAVYFTIMFGVITVVLQDMSAARLVVSALVAGLLFGAMMYAFYPRYRYQAAEKARRKEAESSLG